ncbi:aldose epimerase family protein [Streptococcus massiliensis]|uniref:Aldose 1-epimerase n=2 Tax=Streptococcus massiliensis TaxID=313439 RepID=A0A380L0C5_9STRE|nr:aldose epimerase family protein [Streptococcus massiliensis]SUN77009.1 aldose 1-epimerase [Streptococcus massiliensis]
MKAYHTEIFGNFKGQDILRYTFENETGYRLSVMNYGATILEYATPDKEGKIENILLAFDSFEEYVGNSPRFGASIGPVAGRIATASFDLGDKHYELEANNGTNNLHSGSTGFEGIVFQVEEISNDGLTFFTERADGTGGFPGHLKVWISFALTEKGELEVSYQIQTDKDTLVNPTNHSYFNLSGDFTQTIDDTQVQLATEGIYPIDDNSIPLGGYEIPDFVKDLQEGTNFSHIFASKHEQIQLVGGIDHPFELREEQLAATFYDPETGRKLTLKTDRPVLVIYTANVYDDTTYLSGQPARIHNGFALEAQALPDAIHTDKCEEVILRAGQIFTSTTIYHATVQ